MSWTKFGLAFGWEIAQIISVKKVVEPPVQSLGDLQKRWSEIFPHAPPLLNAMPGATAGA